MKYRRLGKTNFEVVENAQAAALPPLAHQQMEALAQIYHEQIRPMVHQRW